MSGKNLKPRSRGGRLGGRGGIGRMMRKGGKRRRTSRRRRKGKKKKKNGKGVRGKRRLGERHDGGSERRGGREMEEKKKKKEEDSSDDLRYETLIKIISSASVGCRGAYTTASRECNDLNGNNSVKDGCSRCPFPMRARILGRVSSLPTPATPSHLPSPIVLVFVLHERE